MQIDVCYGADLMIMASTLETRWELLHQCLAEDSGSKAVDPAAEATPAGSGAIEAADAAAEPSSKKAAAKRLGTRSQLTC